MTLEQDQRDIIKEALLTYRKQFEGTDKKFAQKFGLNVSVFSRIKGGEPHKRLVSDDEWVRIGRMLNVPIKNGPRWNIVHTETFEYMTEQMAHCKLHSVARIFCDKADIGKSEAARWFMLNNPNVFYVDCSLSKSKRAFLRALASSVGIKPEGNIKAMIDDVIYMLQATRNPLVILDEAGDLDYEAWLEIKALWNYLEGYCGWYMIGADGLKAKIDRNVRNKKVGYAEIFRRFGSDYMSVTPKNNPTEEKQFFVEQANMILNVNLPGAALKEVMQGKEILSLTRLKENIQKRKLIQRPEVKSEPKKRGPKSKTEIEEATLENA